MQFVESRLIGLKNDETGRELVLSFIESGGRKFAVDLHGVERLLIQELRQQNVVEELVHWTQKSDAVGLREAAFALVAGVAEAECDPRLAVVAQNIVDRVMRGELEMLEIRAVFGAQGIASFARMAVRSEE